LSGGPVVYGLLLGALGGGAILGALAAAWLRQRFPTELIVDGGSLAFGVASIVAAVSPTLAFTIPVLMIGGAAWVITLSTFNISVQLSVPRWVVGRAVAVYQTTTFGGMALGSWFWGVVAYQIGLGPTLVGVGIGLGLSIALGAFFPLPTAGSANLDPWRDPSNREESITVSPLSGPVVTTLEYRVAPADHAPFAAFMLRWMRPMRERDGALRWTLLQDLVEPTIWIERFHNPTWLDHLRQNHRRTVEDHDLEVRALAFHQSATPPRVRHFLETDSARGNADDHHEW
jgi:MFS family permease